MTADLANPVLAVALHSNHGSPGPSFETVLVAVLTVLIVVGALWYAGLFDDLGDGEVSDDEGQ